MSHNPLKFLTSTLVSSCLVLSPVAAEAGGTSHTGSGGYRSGGAVPCPPGGGATRTGGMMKNMDVYKPSSVNKNKNIDVYKPTTINKNKNIDVYKPTTINNNKNIDVYKPTTINKTINNNKNIDVYKPTTINKNINNSKNINITNNIDNSKNININKSIVINKGSSDSEASAIAAAIAAASANSSSNASVNFYGSVNGGNSSSSANSNSYSNAASYNGGSFAGNVGSVVSEAPGMYGSTDFGTVAVNVETPAPAPVAAARPQCTIQETTVIKAIHAVCVSADGHEFPASHMLGDTWIESSYEGEIARCLPGSHLKVAVGSVFQSSEGLASGWSSGQTLECGPHEAVRHFKGGMLKCAPAVAVPDCTERTNLRKFGTGDMFFTYRAKVCLETRQEYTQSDTTTQMTREEELRGYSRSSSSSY